MNAVLHVLNDLSWSEEGDECCNDCLIMNCTVLGRSSLRPALRERLDYGLKGLRETTKPGLQDAWFPGRNFKPDIPEYQILYQDFAYAVLIVHVSVVRSFEATTVQSAIINNSTTVQTYKSKKIHSYLIKVSCGFPVTVHYCHGCGFGSLVG